MLALNTVSSCSVCSCVARVCSYALQIYNTRAGAFTINTATGFSAVLVSGTQYARPSFLADVAASVSQTSTGWKQISNYVTHSTQSWTWGLHKFGNGTLNNGVYTVPQTGECLVNLLITAQTKRVASDFVVKLFTGMSV